MAKNSRAASLSIDAAAANDTVTISSVDADGPFNASLIINGGTGDDTVNLNANINFAAGNLTAHLSFATDGRIVICGLDPT